MTIKQFNNTRWRAGTKVLCRPMGMRYEPYVAVVVSVNFDQALIATVDEDSDDTESWLWHRCESCEIVNHEEEER